MIRVLEIGQAIAGPYAAQILRDLGAEVIKIERPGQGDIFRDTEGMGPAMFIAVNRGKKSVTLDLKTEEGRELLRELVKVSDVVIESLDYEASKNLGLDYKEFLKMNPNLIYCKITAFGEGPYEKLPAFDPVLQAVSGIMSVTGFPPDKFARAGVSMIDMTTGLYAAIAILSALLNNERGKFIEISMFDVALSYMSYWIAYYDLYKENPEPLGTTHRFGAPYNLFKVKDGYIYISIMGDSQWRKFCQALGFQDLLEREEFKTSKDRVKNKETLEKIVQDRLKDMELREVFGKLLESGVAAAPLNNVENLLKDPHLASREILHQVKYGDKILRIALNPIKINGKRIGTREDPPFLGDSTVEVLKNILKLDDKEIEELKRKKVI